MWDKDEWLTPHPYIAAARAVMGSIDCDPATSENANKIIHAPVYYTTETNGLMQPWHGNVWMNPPYSGKNIRTFCNYLLWQFKQDITKQAIALINAQVLGRAWFEPFWDFTICIVRKRINFLYPDGTLSKNSNHTSAFLYMGTNIQNFVATFRHIGYVVQKVKFPNEY